MEIQDAKTRARKAAFAARKSADASTDLAPATAALLAAVEDQLAGRGAAIIAGYMPIRTEIDPRPAMAALSRAHRIAVPVIVGDGLPLKFRHWTPEAAMVPGPFGAQVPAEGDWLVPDLIILPLVAFDRRGTRLGYGGGFYDRSLAQLTEAASRPAAIGFAYAAQELPELPREPTDQPLDLIVTEIGALIPQP
ncbi:MAG: 5-formyltetrahydrofolate cyclo-ligase [Pseudomonadota bacterium]